MHPFAREEDNAASPEQRLLWLMGAAAQQVCGDDQAGPGSDNTVGVGVNTTGSTGGSGGGSGGVILGFDD